MATVAVSEEDVVVEYVKDESLSDLFDLEDGWSAEIVENSSGVLFEVTAKSISTV